MIAVHIIEDSIGDPVSIDIPNVAINSSQADEY